MHSIRIRYTKSGVWSLESGVGKQLSGLLGKNGAFGHIRVFEKNEFEVLDVGTREDVWGMTGGKG